MRLALKCTRRPLCPAQLHYLLHGTGFQTWEYSPAYGIRSYAYILLHSLPLLPLAAFSKVAAALHGVSTWRVACLRWVRVCLL